MRGLQLIPVALLGLVTLCPEANAVTGAQMTGVIGCTYGLDFFVRGVPRGNLEAGTNYRVSDLHAIADQQALINMLNEAASEVFAACVQSNPTVAAIFIEGPLGSGAIVQAWMYKPEGVWHFQKNNVVQIIADQERRRAEQERQLREQQERAARDAHEIESKKSAAITDCGSAPSVSGGPWSSWFTSAYSVGALDEARRGDFFCVKSIEYISPAPNPFGGSAARAQFTGYSASNFEQIVQVRDFIY